MRFQLFTGYLSVLEILLEVSLKELQDIWKDTDSPHFLPCPLFSFHTSPSPITNNKPQTNRLPMYIIQYRKLELFFLSPHMLSMEKVRGKVVNEYQAAAETGTLLQPPWYRGRGHGSPKAQRLIEKICDIFKPPVRFGSSYTLQYV